MVDDEVVGGDVGHRGDRRVLPDPRGWSMRRASGSAQTSAPRPCNRHVQLTEAALRYKNKKSLKFTLKIHLIH